MAPAGWPHGASLQPVNVALARRVTNGLGQANVGVIEGDAWRTQPDLAHCVRMTWPLISIHGTEKVWSGTDLSSGRRQALRGSPRDWLGFRPTIVSVGARRNAR